MSTLPLDLIHNLSLSESEGRVYFATLELGQSTIQEISRKSGVKRTSIYNFIESMKARGLLIQTRKKNREYFSALHPSQLLSREKMKVQRFESLLPELLAIANRHRGRPRVQFFEGLDGVRSAYAHELEAKKEILSWSDFEAGNKLLGKEFFNEYFVPARIRRGIYYRGMVVDSPASHHDIKFNNRRLRETKMLPTTSQFLTEIDIFNDTVALISFHSHPPVAVLIEDPALATTMRFIWTTAWNSLE